MNPLETEEAAENSSEIKESLTQITPPIPIDVIFDILSRLPVKSLRRYECVSRTWCSLIQSSMFSSSYIARSLENPVNRYALLIVAHDKSNSQRHFFSAPYTGGSTTLLFTLSNIPSDKTEVDILKDLVLFRRENGYMKYNFAYVINPSTHEDLKLPGKAAQPRFSYGNVHICYFFGFDPSTDRFKVLNTRIIGMRTPKKRVIECGLFDVSSCSWKRIDPVFPFDILGEDWIYWHRSNVCVNGVIYIFLHHSNVLAAFDLREEKFSLISLPQGTVPSDIATVIRDGPNNGVYFNYPYLINYNGLLAVICYEKIVFDKVVEMWILEDVVNQKWLKETITLPESWDSFGAPIPRGVIFTGELMFSPRKVSRECLLIHFYDMKKGSFRSIDIRLAPEWLASDDIDVQCHGGYFESISRLRRNR